MTQKCCSQCGWLYMIMIRNVGQEKYYLCKTLLFSTCLSPLLALPVISHLAPLVLWPCRGCLGALYGPGDLGQEARPGALYGPVDLGLVTAALGCSLRPYWPWFMSFPQLSEEVLRTLLIGAVRHSLMLIHPLALGVPLPSTAHWQGLSG
jgi:hypothetical protein